MAQDLKYLYSWFAALYNNERSYLLPIENQKEGQLSQEKAYQFVFSELPAYIVERNTRSDDPAIFRLAEQITLYNKRLEQ